MLSSSHLFAFSIVLSCPLISSRVIVIIQARSGLFAAVNSKRLRCSLSGVSRYSELGTGCGWFYTPSAWFLGKGRSFLSCLRQLARSSLGEESKSPPCCRNAELVDNPTWGTITTVQEIPPSSRPPPIPTCVANVPTKWKKPSRSCVVCSKRPETLQRWHDDAEPRVAQVLSPRKGHIKNVLEMILLYCLDWGKCRCLYRPTGGCLMFVGYIIVVMHQVT